MEQKRPPPQSDMPALSSLLSMKFMAAAFYLTEKQLAQIEEAAANNNLDITKSGLQ